MRDLPPVPGCGLALLQKPEEAAGVGGRFKVEGAHFPAAGGRVRGLRGLYFNGRGGNDGHHEAVGEEPVEPHFRPVQQLFEDHQPALAC